MEASRAHRDDPRLFLHASSVLVDGGAVLFLGHSTAGKSTIANCLSAICPLIADDTVSVWRDDHDIWRVKDGKDRNRPVVPLDPMPVPAVPLRACFRIHKGEEIRTEPLAPIDLARCLMDAVMEVDMQRKCGRLDTRDSATAPAAIAESRSRRGQWFGWVVEMARRHPGQRMWFPRQADPETLHRVLE